MIAAICIRMILIGISAISLAGCVRGNVNTAFYSAPPQPPMFIVISPDSRSPTEHNISALIEAKMSKIGYQKVNSIQAANIGVLYKYSIDPSGSIYSDGSGYTSTSFPRHFQIAVIDLQKSKMPEKIEFLWQGEVYSAGTSRDISQLAPDFVEALFENYGKTVTNKSFMK